MDKKKDKKVKNMKILIVRTFPDILKLNSYNVQEVGLAKALTVRGHQCDIVLYNGSNRDKTENYCFELNQKEYSFTIFWLKGYSFLKNGFMPSLKELIENYDVIQVHEYDQILSWKIYTEHKRPTVIYHGPYYHQYAKGYNLKCKIFDLLFLRKKSYYKVIALTKSELAAKFLRSKGFEHVTAVGVGIDESNFMPSESVDIEKSEKISEFSLLYVGKIEERRNVYFLISIFRKLRERYPEVRLMIVGNGENNYVKQFLAFIQCEIENGFIVYRKSATQRELAAIYRKSKLFLFTSNYEIFGMVLLEAMYCGVPVVSSMNGGASTLIRNGENGCILQGFDETEWFETIGSLIQNEKKRAQLAIEAKETIETRFLWKRVAEKFETSYKQAIELNSSQENHF